MRVLVTGAAGFIGSHLVDRLVRDGHHVAAVDDLSSGNEANLAAAGAAAEFHRLDVTGPGLRELASRWRPEVVCHLAAQVSVRESIADPLHDAVVNVIGTVNVLEAARVPGCRKVVFTSSVAVYGIPAALPVSADGGLSPRSPYAASKICGEVYLDTYRALHGLDFTTLTLANVYGPRQRPGGEAGVVAILADGLLRGERTHVYGDGSQTRDYVYVEDVVDAFARACTERGSGRRFNIGTGILTSDLALHSLIAEIAGAPDTPEFAPPRPGDLPAMAVDPLPAQDGLGWVPATSLRDGIKATVDWLRRQNHRL
ncbi:MAG: NAD-dependent epimerase/dehydratase family protein [Micromonosporaceae bacterium]